MSWSAPLPTEGQGTDLLETRVWDALSDRVIMASYSASRSASRASDNAEAELHNVRAYLVNVLELVERDPGIEAASDDLYQVAATLAEGTDKGTRMVRPLNEAFLRVRDRLAVNMPGQLARHMGLE
jgi:hypothetical protein